MNRITNTFHLIRGILFFGCAAMLLGLTALSLSAADVSAPSAAESSQPGNVTVSGTVTDENGEPLIAASVFEKGTTNGVVTDNEGRFSIQIPNGNAVLVFSYIGFETQELVPGSRSNISITLSPDSKILEESVVIGYGTVKRKDLTGSVSTVRGDEVAARKTTTLSTALQGTMPGVLVQRTSSAPGSSASSIRVRGITTMGTSDPLIIVDGVQTSDIDYVNSNDVESITVLKDAAAASIYGSKAAAGVILITTKRGSKSDMSITYTGEFGLEIATEQPQMVGVTRYMEMYNELLYNDNPAGGFYQQFSADQVKNWVKYNQTDPDNYPITDWNDLILNKTAPKQTHTVSVNGGNEVVRSQVSLSYDSVNALYDGRKFQRFMLRANNDFTIIKDLLFASLDINIRRAKNKRPVYDPFDDLRKTPAIYAAVWENGAIAEGKSGANPYGLLYNSGTYTAWSTQIGGKASIELRPVKGLSIQANVAPFINYTKSKQFKLAATWYLQDDPTTVGGYLSGGGSTYNSTSLTENRNDSYTVTSQVIANYQHSFKDKHNISAMAGYENYVLKSETLSAGRDYYELTEYPYLNVGPEDYQTNAGSASEYTSNSVFGRFMYDYKGKYLFQANVRADASSRFAKGYRWGVFPSFSVGWVLSEENFMKSTRSWLSFLKLRASWGQLGNERIGSDYFPYMALVSFSDALFYENGEVVSNKSSYMTELAVEDITWETTTSTDVGVDMNFFNQRLHASFDYYWKKTEDMLLSIQIPYTMGYSNPSTNAGTMKTNGYDIEVGWRDRVGEWGYNISFNLSDFLSKITYLNGSTIISSGKIKAEGLYFNEWYGYICDGIYQTEEEVANSATTSSAVTVGDLKYRDISGPDGEPDGQINEYDLTNLGNSLPRYQFGGQIGFDWRGIDASVTFQGIGKQNSYMYDEMVEVLRDNYGGFQSIIDGKYWSVFNTDEQNANAKYPRLSSTSKSNNYATSDFWIFNGRYFRLKNVTVGYTFPSRWMQKAKIKNLRIYASANDVFSIDKYPKGWDPEMGVTSYPITTSIIFGLSIKF